MPRSRALTNRALPSANRGSRRARPWASSFPAPGGRPANTRALLGVIADQGYRALGLEYDDTPAVVGVCPRVPDPDCSANFRRMRATGDGPGAPGVSNSAAESIVNRLVAALKS